MAHFENILIHVLTFDNSPQLYGLIKKISINLNVKILVYEYYLVKDTNTLNIKAKSNNIESNMIVLNEILFNPPLDGTDQITKWTNMTNTTSNGIFQSHGSFLTEGWSNEGLWQLDFDVQCNNWKYIGLMPLCDARINPYTDAKQAQYAATTWEGLSIPHGFSATWVKTCSFSKITDKNWHHVTMKKIASNQVQIFIDGGYEHIWQSDVFAGISELHFGTRDNEYSRNYGGIINFKNIIVKLL